LKFRNKAPFKQEFEEVKGSDDPEIINDFLIKKGHLGM
jgi:hypothetical protein